METFGQKVRQAVESRGLRFHEVAEATGLDIEQLEALARDDFGALPDDETVRDALRSFARLVGVDPVEVIADYAREKERRLVLIPVETRSANILELDDEPERNEEPLPPTRPLEVESSRTGIGRRGAIGILASAILALIVVAILVRPRASTVGDSGRAPAGRRSAPTEQAAAGTAAAAPAAGTEAEHRVTPEDLPSEPDPAIEMPAGESELAIHQDGVGRGVINHQLVGETDQFQVGERVWYWTLLEGGAGETIEHVWLHEGREINRVRLKSGGVRWRTKSYKYLNASAAGSWVVEARDEAGRVLSRCRFHVSSQG